MSRLALPAPLRALLRGRGASLLLGTTAFAVRLYLASIWLRFSLQKLEQDWPSTNPLRPLFEAIVAGHIPAPLPGYAVAAEAMLAARADVVLSIAIPFAELAIGLAFLSGLLVRPAAIAGIALNVNLVLAGVASLALDGRVIALQIVLLALGRASEDVGVRPVAAAVARGVAVDGRGKGRRAA